MKVKAIEELEQKNTFKSRYFLYEDLETGEIKEIRFSKKFHKNNIRKFVKGLQTEIYRYQMVKPLDVEPKPFNFISKVHNIK